ncbi:MAG: helix-turn-helix transcriptional regulator [Clostridia bacterium]|nr:helix-turn-helix transcriptional regulator [Clostridia bacterium]
MNKIFCKIIQDERMDRDLSQTQMAIILKTNQQKISRMELGQFEPSLQDIENYCKFFNLSADYILGFTKQKAPFPKD